MEPPPLSSSLSPAAMEALKAKIRQEILAEGYTMDPSISDTKAAAQPCPETLKTEEEARNTAQHQSPTTDRELPTKITSIEATVGSLTCDLCNTTLTSQAQLDEHRSGRKHKAKVRKHKAKETKAGSESGSLSGTKRKPEAVSAGVFGCHLCQVSVNSAEMLDSHRKGKKHKAKETGPGSALGGEEGVGVLMCGLCGVECNGQTSMDLHLDGKKHKAKVTGSGSALGGEEGVGVLMCGLCGVECNEQTSMDLHLDGKMHKANVEKVGKVL